MEESDKYKSEGNLKNNPIKSANVLSQLFFCWPLPIFYRGLRKDLGEDDLYEALDEHESGDLGDKFEYQWNIEKSTKNPSLWRVLRRVFGREICLLGFMLFAIEMGLKLVHPICLAKLMLYYVPGQNKITQSEAYLYAGFIVVASFANVLVGHQLMFRNIHLGMQMRIASCSLVYRKSLRLSKGALADTTVGQMVNLLSNDVNRFDMVLTHLHNIWIAPLQVLVIVCIMYTMVGAISLLGIIFLVLFIPLQVLLSEKSSKYRFKIALRTDERVRLMNEIICGIQVIKMYTWEKPFAKMVETARKVEVSKIQATSYIRALLLSLSMFMHRTAVFICILCYVLMDYTLTAYYVFVVTSFYNILRVSMTMHFPIALAAIAELRVSVRRLQTFLMSEETGTEEVKRCKFATSAEKEECEVRMRGLSAKWITGAAETTITDADFHVKPHELAAVVGPVGGGKSSLLNVILDELRVVDGSLDVTGTISYASQEPWLFAGSIRQNILFGQMMNLKKYSEVIRVCSLEKDFEVLPHGDRTIVGERGIMLSGGQKARINLARAVYKDADIYLLDDPLSAVDAHVSKHLFDKCIQGYLKEKCTVLVTHQLQYLRSATRIYLVEEGRVEMFESYDDLKKSETNFVDALGEEENKEGKAKQRTNLVAEYERPVEIRENKSVGSISGTVYLAFLKAAGGYPAGLYVLFLFAVTQCSASFADYFNGYWVNLEQRRIHNDITTGNAWDQYLTTFNCIYIYTSFVGFIIVISLLRSMQFMHFCMVASKKLHNKMFSFIINATMRFFNTNPSGRILNRFSKDTGSIDEILPSVILDTFQIGFSVLSISIVVAIINPWTLIITVVILIIFYCFRVVFLKSSRNIKRMEGTTRSPVFTHIAASLQGVATIRAFSAQNILKKEFDNLQNVHSSAYYLFTACNRAFGFWLDLHCVIYIAAVTMSFLIMDVEAYGGNVGLAITQSLALTGMFQWGMRQWSEWENQMTSVERVLEYTDLEQEPTIAAANIDKDWPHLGSIKFCYVHLRYSVAEPYVLRNLNFEICPREKIGIVGRTGAGKSSIITCLFLLTSIDGGVFIDDVDTGSVPLEVLRSKISIIPQEPVLFSGTLRKNLDPFEEYDDVVIWSALEDVELKNVVSYMPSGLNSKMSEGGSNFSVGQRQLFCLARAIIRKNRILVMDEATANVDPNTDELIQKTIRKKFRDCTVLTIAHRLHTVMDSDRILIMDAGEVVEFDQPYVLLQNREGKLYSLIKETDKAMAGTLMKIAEENYKS